MLWGREPEPWSWYFSETNRTYPHAYQVWRPAFDKILLDNARTAGVQVCEGHQVTGVDVRTGHANSLDFRADDGSSGSIEADWVIDASGQSAILGRSLRLRRWDERFRNMAVYAYFEGSERLPGPDVSNIFIESYADGWVWNIPLWKGLSSVGFVVDSEQGASGIARHGVDGYFRRQLGSTSRTSEMLSSARLVEGPQVVKDWSYTSSQTVGDGWILVGDAACFVDPLFSSGVHLAMMSAVMAAAYLDASRSDPSMRDPAARVYQELYHTEYSHFRELAALFYASNRTVESYFWESRRILGEPEDEEARKSFIRAVAGQSARGYERAVLSKGALPEEFSSSVRALESERYEKATGFSAESVLQDVPALASGSAVDRRPVFADGQFQWSDVLVSRQRPEGVAVSPFVTSLIAEIDGSRSVHQIVKRIAEKAPGNSDGDRVAQAVLSTLKILTVDGLIESQARGPQI